MKVFFDSQCTVPKPLRIPYFVLESILWSPLEGSLDALVVPEALEHGLEGGEGEVGEAGGAIVQQELGEEGERSSFGHVHWTMDIVQRGHFTSNIHALCQNPFLPAFKSR